MEVDDESSGSSRSNTHATSPANQSGRCWLILQSVVPYGDASFPTANEVKPVLSRELSWLLSNLFPSHQRDQGLSNAPRGKEEEERITS